MNNYLILLDLGSSQGTTQPFARKKTPQIVQHSKNLFCF